MRENLKDNEISQTILDIAQGLLQAQGYNSFSYRDLSHQVGIRTSSIHYYFPTKGDLAKALTVRYREHFKMILSQIDRQTDEPKKKLELYLKLFLDGFEACKKVCLCSMLAADFGNMPKEVQDEVKGIFADNEAWLTKVLEAGHKAMVFRFKVPSEAKARIVFAALEGATISARIFADEGRLLSVTSWLKSILEAKD
jgi:TetR/AcrR family transcriptional repressor of nem operon